MRELELDSALLWRGKCKWIQLCFCPSSFIILYSQTRPIMPSVALRLIRAAAESLCRDPGRDTRTSLSRMRRALCVPRIPTSNGRQSPLTGDNAPLFRSHPRLRKCQSGYWSADISQNSADHLLNNKPGESHKDTHNDGERDELVCYQTHTPEISEYVCFCVTKQNIMTVFTQVSQTSVKRIVPPTNSLDLYINKHQRSQSITWLKCVSVSLNEI